VNPLSKYFRKPSVYISLPTGGDWYAPGGIVFDNGQELGVMPMTAKDEMMMNTPDALINSQSTIDIIKSCVPGIKDPWSMPTLDLDTVLIGIRIASYGENMDINIQVPEVNKQMAYTVDLRQLMDQIDRTKFDPFVQIDNQLTVKVKPMTYRQLTNLQLKTYEQQRLVTQVSDAKLSSAERQKTFNDIFTSMTNITLDNMKEAIVEINAEGETIVDRSYINEFVDNMQSDMANKIKEHMDKQVGLGKIKPITVSVPEEMVKEGAPKTVTSPISLDNSNFFVRRS
tara:strand:- start:129 stop:980 length:852 start_codon:yes stop_codon:yes gene_type:complete